MLIAANYNYVPMAIETFVDVARKHQKVFF
jgi:hypothetical protein